MNRRLPFAICCLFLAACAASACGGNKEGEPPPLAETAQSGIGGSITVVTNRTDMIDTKYKEYAERFRQKYPSVNVRFEALRDYDRNMKIRLASGETPDVLLIPSIPNADLPKFFSPLDDVKLQGELYFRDFKTQHGHLYGIPSGVAVSGVVYNKKSFAAAGISRVPDTLDAFYEACEKLKRIGIVPFASNFKDRWPLQVWSNDVPVLLSGSAAIKNEMAYTDAPFQPDSPYGISMSIVKTLYRRGYLEANLNDTNWERSKREIAEGKTAMTLTGNWAVNQLIEHGAKPSDIGFFPFPPDNSGKLRVTLYPDRYYAVGKNTKHAAAAKAFVKWMVEESGYEHYAGFIPVLKERRPSLPQLEELDSCRPEYVEAVMDTDVLSQIQNKGQIEMPSIVQEYILGDPGEVLDKYNKQWEQARKTLKMHP